MSNTRSIARLVWEPRLYGSLVQDINPDMIAGNDGDAIATLTNQAATGSSGDYTQGIAGSRGLIKRGTINGHSSILLDGTDDWYETSFNSPPTACTHFIVFKTVVNPTDGNTAVVAVDGTATPDHVRVLYLRNHVVGCQAYESGAKCINNSDQGYGYGGTGTGVLDTNAHIHGFTYNNGAHDSSGSYTMSLDGVAKTLGAGSVLNIPTTYRSTIGCIHTGAAAVANWNGHLIRKLVFNTDLSAVQYATVQQYLHNLYGI